MLQFEVLLVEGRRQTGVFLEQLTEIGVARAKLGSYLLHGYLLFHTVAYAQACLVYHVHVSALAAKFHLALERVHQAEQVVHHTGQYLLAVYGLLLSRCYGQFVQMHYVVAETNVVNGFLQRQEVILQTVVHVTALIPYPVTFPRIHMQGVVRMPFAGEQKEYVTGLNVYVLHVFRREYAFAFDKVKHLILVKGTSALDVEIISVAMSLGRIFLVRSYLVIPYRIDNQPPLGVALCRYQIFTVLHVFSLDYEVVGSK